MAQALIEIHLVKPCQVLGWWPQVSKWVSDALEYDLPGLVSPQDALKTILSGCGHLWLISVSGRLVAAATTEIFSYPQGRTLTVVALGGSCMSDWVEALDDTLTRWGQDNGCKYIVTHGRKGWGRVLDKLGWKQAHVTLAKEL